MNNKVFYQHPNLMRALGMHETVMEVMVNVLGEGKSKVRVIQIYGVRKGVVSSNILSYFVVLINQPDTTQ